ncbi:MAG TPA: glycosyltransferase family 4 protein [Candidatus Paceibacterota bacterium]
MAIESNILGKTHGSLKKKVLFIITQSELGGAQRFLSNLISHLDREIYEFMVAVGSSGNGDFLRVLNAGGISHQTLRFLKREPALSDIRAIFEIRSLIKKYRPDVLFLNSSKAGFIGSLAAIFPTRINAVKVIYRIGGWSFNDPWPKWKRWLWVVLEWLSAKWKDIIIVNNQRDLNQAKKLKIRPRGQTILVHNGIEVYKLDIMQREEARTKLFEKVAKSCGKNIQVKNVIGTIANFYPTKGLEYLIGSADYFGKSDDIAFFIIGDGELRSGLEKMIRENGLEKKVFLLGQIPDAYRFLSAFDVFVLSSVKEGFPWVLIEAMSAKLPVIATDVGAVPEIIDDHKNGLIVKPRDSAGLADKIKEVLENDRLKNELGIQAHQTVLFRFELDKMVKEIEIIL